jgi:NMD protein affecting ribosome stability and mRNA decay
LTIESLLKKRSNDNAINIIINSVNEGIDMLFGNITTTHEMWNILLNQYEANFQIKKTK